MQLNVFQNKYTPPPWICIKITIIIQGHILSIIQGFKSQNYGRMPLLHAIYAAQKTLYIYHSKSLLC